MTDLIHPLRHAERDPAEDPTGEALLDRARRPWQAWVPPSPALVLGNSQTAERELNVAAVLRDRIPVHRRIGGGGAVLLSPGCVCLALRFRKRQGLSIHDYFASGSSVIIAMARERLGLELALRGVSDLACPTPAGEKKVAGSSLYMPRDFVLYLVSILVSPDLGQIGAYLAHPSQEPAYRAGRPHEGFLAGLAALSQRAITPAETVDWFREAIPERLGPGLDWEFAKG